MSEALSQKKCLPCQGGIPPLDQARSEELLKELGADWEIVQYHHLKKEFSFSNFKEALEFTNQVGEIAEIENHHPDIYLAWGKVIITIWTHKIDGLNESDFILAAKINQI